eukprot:4714544-Prymnesium_polylepis.1
MVFFIAAARTRATGRAGQHTANLARGGGGGTARFSGCGRGASCACRAREVACSQFNRTFRRRCPSPRARQECETATDGRSAGRSGRAES